MIDGIESLGKIEKDSLLISSYHLINASVINSYKQFVGRGQKNFPGWMDFEVGVSIDSAFYAFITWADSFRRGLEPGVTGSIIPRPDYTRVHYGLGQFIPRGIIWPRPIYTPSGHNILLSINWPTP